MARNTFWEIPGVEYRGQVGEARLLKSLLDGGAIRIQDKWLEYSRKAIAEGRPSVPSSDFLYQTTLAVYKRRNDPGFKKEALQVRDFLRESFREFILTSTRIANLPSGDGVVMHNYRLENQANFFVKEIIGGSEKIKDSKNSKLFKALLGSSRTREINNVLRWISEHDNNLFRVDDKPEDIIETVAGFGADSDWAGQGCSRDLSNTYSSLGVGFRAKN